MFMMLLIISSCGQTTSNNTTDQTKKDSISSQANSATQEYVGTYKTTDEGNCTIEIAVTSLNNEYHYKIKSKSKNQEGIIDVTKSNGEVFFDFKGLIGADKKSTVSGQYMDNKIVIQNDGNAMNEYTYFSECDMKYIELSKK